MKKIKNCFTLILIFICINSFSQLKSKTIYFEIYYEKDYPIAGANIVEREAKKINETTTDFDGKAQLIVTNFNSEFELSFTGPHVRFKIPEKTEKIIINIDKRRIEYYHNDKIFKRKRVKLKGF
ncbi:MAG: hypothetical protein RSE15_11960 [Flavobacterium sp.]|jgi:hypothetical protein|uniref:hypothetical protein n=1 Tax=Flavobacterium sp. TaxID=239 RepID=UPI001B641EEB|nr:hypothetical protein [Flavobacterium sp.]MBP9849171.1 hypothetical protein [Flavobacterium sp.]WRH73060.1 MAG: hypothetical protein RSE15_11960 [Flavobacterium sp.]